MGSKTSRAETDKEIARILAIQKAYRETLQIAFLKGLKAAAKIVETASADGSVDFEELRRRMLVRAYGLMPIADTYVSYELSQVLSGAGLDTWGRVGSTSREVLESLPGMTPEFIHTLGEVLGDVYPKLRNP